jgi:hypothetical protein
MSINPIQPTIPFVLCALLACLVCSSAWGQPSVFEGALTVQALNVKIEAVSTSIHVGGQNQETYLAEVVGKSGDRQLVKLIDVYPAPDTRIDRDLLRELPLLKMKAVRAKFCDVLASQFFFSDDSIVFDEAIKADIRNDPSASLPCFRIIHRSVTLKTRSSPKRISGT